MNLLHTLRQTPRLARWSAWLFALVLLSAGAAPWLSAPGPGLICSASTAATGPTSPSGDPLTDRPADGTLHCPLCLSGLAAVWLCWAAPAWAPRSEPAPAAAVPRAPNLAALWRAPARAPPPAS